jgi:hypothetical protein
MSKRTIVKHKKSYYAERDAKGRFVSFSNIGKSIAEDSRTKAKKKVKPGHGHEGDLKK